jgi:type III secretion protein C
MPLREVLSTFGTTQGISVVMSERVAGTVSGDFRGLPPQEFLNRIAMLHNLTWYYDGAILYVYSDGEIATMLLDLQYMKAAEVREMLRDLGMEDERFPIKTTSDDELLMVAGPPRYVQVVAELVAKADRLREKRAYSEVETRIFFIHHTWADDVNLNVSGVESGASIKGIAKMLEELLVDSGSTNVRNKSENGDDTESKDALQLETDKKFKPVIKAENRLNAVIVKDVASRMPLYEEMIAKLDVPVKLVEIAVTTLEMSKNDALDWQLSLAVKGRGGDVEGGAGQNAANLFSIEDLAGKGLAGALSYIGNHVTVSASLSALRQKGKARSISRTSLLTMNNMGATLTDMQSYHVRVVGSEVASLQEVSVGTTINVKPRLVMAEKEGQQNKFWMTVSLSDGGFESVSVDSMPLTRSSSLTTQAAVYEGDCILLAGYFRDIEEKAGWGIPYLRDIPYIGWIFGGITKKKESRQRLFILSPYIVEIDTEDLANVQATRQRDIRREERLEEDKLEDDSIREIRDLEREDRDKARRQKYADLLEKRKAELEFEKEKREAERKEERKEWKEDLKEDREFWEEGQKQKQEAEKRIEAEMKAREK